MKKYILILIFAFAVTSCHKYQPDGNPDNLKLTDSIVHYTDKDAPKSTYVKKDESSKVGKPNLIEPDLMVKKAAAEVAVKAPAAK
ncbi:hypothetical protein [Halpernia sp. GG3]